MAGGEAACQPARKKTGRLSPAGKAGSSACGAASPASRLRDDERLYHMSWPDYAVILSSRLLFLSLVAPSAPGWHPVVKPDSAGQLLAHLPGSAEPAGAVSGFATV